MLQQNNIFEGHESVVLSTDVNTEGTMLATTSLDCKIRIFDLRTAKMVSFVTSQVGPYSCVKFSPDGSQFISGSRSGDVHVFDVKTGKMLKTYEIDSEKIYSISVAYVVLECQSFHTFSYVSMTPQEYHSLIPLENHWKVNA